MSARTPGLQTRSQFHSYWGQYFYNVGAGVWANGSNLLPGAPGNPLTAVEFAKIEVGDIASTTDGAIANRGLFVCVDTPTAATVEWRRMDDASSVVQTIRDAHVIVVGQTGILAGLAGAGSPPLPANGLNLGGVGDVAGITCDYLDTGDGAQLQLALAAALAAGIGVDVRLRPMLITLTPATVGTDGLDISDNCRLIGAGRHSSSITGTDGTGGVTQTVATLRSFATIEDLTCVSQQPAAAPGGAQLGVVEAQASAKVLRCNINLEVSVTVDRVQTIGINFNSPDGNELCDDCDLSIDSLNSQPTPAISTGIQFGSNTKAYRTAYDPEVRNTTINENSNGVGACAAGVLFRNCEGGRVFNVEHVNARTPVSSFGWTWFITSVPQVTVLRGPKFIECRLFGIEDDSIPQIGVYISVAGTPNLAGVIDSMIHDCVMRFTPAANPNPGIQKRGYLIQNAATDGSDILFVTIDNCRSHFSNRGFVIDASGGLTVGKINGVKMTACIDSPMQDGGSSTPRGCIIRGSGSAIAPRVKDCGIHNCLFTDAPATGAGIEIEDVGVDDTIIIGNSLRPNAGSALIDGGTGTEAAHNILV